MVKKRFTFDDMHVQFRASDLRGLKAGAPFCLCHFDFDLGGHLQRDFHEVRIIVVLPM